MEVHHALVLSFCVGVAVSAGPSSEKSPLRFRSTNNWQRSAGCSALAVASTPTHDDCAGPSWIMPFRAGRTAPDGSFAVASTSTTRTCVPFGEKFGFGLPSAGARYSSGTLMILDCAAIGARLTTR